MKPITEAQRSAITHENGPALVLAGPGSGKTFVITKRVEHLIQVKQIPSENILVITFTRAAANEMKKRTQELIPEHSAYFGTFHSFFYHILKQSYSNFPAKFISSEQKLFFIRNIVRELLDSDFDMEFEEVASILSFYMNNGLSTKNMKVYDDLKPSVLKQIYMAYHQFLSENRVLDFDNLLLQCYELLKNNQEIRRFWSNKFRFILIDECQDMNVVQYEIIKLLANEMQNVFLVGDDDQSIYAFRGARVSLMQRFVEEYREVRRITLTINFRSTKQLVSASKSVIESNKNRFVKEVMANSLESCGLQVEPFFNRQKMIDSFLYRIKEMSEQERNDSALIYRTNRELETIAYRLRRENIAYVCLEEKKSLFQEEWFLDIESYIKLALGSQDKELVLRIANKPNRFLSRVQLINQKTIPEAIDRAFKHIANMRPYLGLKYIWTGIGYGKWMERRYENQESQFEIMKEQLEVLEEIVKGFSSWQEFLSHVEMDRLEQSKKDKTRKRDEKGIHLLTMHASKGLEFQTVFLLDVNEGKLPSSRDLSLIEIEEERRLFYVAMTRAKRKLYISYVGGNEKYDKKPSMFLTPLLKKKEK